MDMPFMDQRMGSIANSQLIDDPGAIIAFPDEAFGLDSNAA